MLTISDHVKPNWSIFAERWNKHDNLSHQQVYMYTKPHTHKFRFPPWMQTNDFCTHKKKPKQSKTKKKQQPQNKQKARKKPPYLMLLVLI